MTASQRKAQAKLSDAAPHGFEGGLSAGKYTAITGLSRATAYRELTQRRFGSAGENGGGQGDAVWIDLAVSHVANRHIWRAAYWVNNLQR